MQSSTASSPQTGRIRRMLPWLAALLIGAAIMPVRGLAQQLDFALGNILTLILGISCWLTLVSALVVSQLPRVVWKLALLLPIVCLAVFLSLFRLERVDGELRPQFVYRWKSLPALPDETSASEFAAELIAPRESDFPQYLGPNRDATLPGWTIASDWESQPPRIAWKHSIGDGWSGFAVQGDVAVTMEQREDQEWISAYNVLDGALLWQTTIDARHFNVMGGAGPRSTPTIFDNRVYACSAVDRFVCLDLTNGRELWSHNLLDLAGTTQSVFELAVAWGRSASALVFDEMVVMPLGGVGDSKRTLIAFDRNSGNELWRAGDDQISYSSPSLVELGGVRQILYTSETKVAGYTIETGETLWSAPWPGSSSGSATVSQPLVIDDSRVLLSKGYGTGAKLLDIRHEDGEWMVDEVWSNESALKTKFTNCVVSDGYIFGLSDGILECVDLETGDRQWKRGRYRQGQLLLVGKKLLITAEDGEVVLVPASPQKFEEVASLPVIGDVSWNTAALSGDRLLMRNSDEVACVILPMEVATDSTPSDTREADSN
jgi:outer membrane protein assembly factor BamB